MSASLLTLESGKWYGWQMLPGYVSDYEPYFSPILIHSVKPKKTGRNIIQLFFANVLYAEGCQDFVVDISITSRSNNFLIGELLEEMRTGHARCAIINEISFEWLRQFCPVILDTGLYGASGRSVQEYLDLFCKNDDMKRVDNELFG